MTSNAVKLSATHGLLVLLVAAAGLASPSSQAQQVYRIVGPDGKVTFSDQPPPSASNAKVTAASGSAGGASAAGLPFELRQVASKYPVTLYTGDNCGPCGAARAMLSSRGIPFSEKTVTTAEDTQALKRLSGDSSIPFLTIGSQQLKGFSDAEWTQFLNAAGYPTTSILPPTYRPPAATPLVTLAPPPAAAAAGAAAATPNTVVRPVTPVAQPSDNPAGIRF